MGVDGDYAAVSLCELEVGKGVHDAWQPCCLCLCQGKTITLKARGHEEDAGLLEIRPNVIRWANDANVCFDSQLSGLPSQILGLAVLSWGAHDGQVRFGEEAHDFGHDFHRLYGLFLLVMESSHPGYLLA